jgi:peptidyl-dipeptidase Dcp
MSNPLISDWQSIHQLPPFEEIKIEHYPPAFERGFIEQLNEIEAIVSNPEPATFANTIETLEASGQILIKVVPVFSILASAHTNDELIELQSDLIPRYTAHNTAIYSRKDLFDRVKAVYESNEVLNGEQRQLLSETHKRMVRSGAALDKEQTARILDLDRQLSRLQTQ